MASTRILLRPILYYGGFPQWKILWRRLTGKRKIFILLYHKIHYQAKPLFGHAVRPDVFERQIIFLKKHYDIVDLKYLNKREYKENSKKDIAVITFDDGYRNNYSEAFPVLKKHNVPATIFLATDYIDTGRLLWPDMLAWIMYKAKAFPKIENFGGNKLLHEAGKEICLFFASDPSARICILRSLADRFKAYTPDERNDSLKYLSQICKVRAWPNDGERVMLTWEEVKEMSCGGISFGSHTRSHPVLSSLPVSEAREEIVESKKMIEEQIQQSVKVFAYPYGKDDDYSEDVMKILREEGFELVCSTTAGTEQYPLSNIMKLRRKGVSLSPYLFF